MIYFIKSKYHQNELEQLERLCSENTPHRPMITHTIDSYISDPKSKKYGKNESGMVDFFSRWKPKN